MPSLELMPQSVVRTGPTWTMAVNRNQNLLGKAMLVLNRPATAVTELSADEWLSLHDELRGLTKALHSLFVPDQFNYAFLMNQDAQVHLHVVPRYAGIRSWGGLVFDDPHWGSSFGTEQRPLDSQTLSRLAAEISDKLTRSQFSR